MEKNFIIFSTFFKLLGFVSMQILLGSDDYFGWRMVKKADPKLDVVWEAEKNRVVGAGVAGGGRYMELL